MSIAEYETESYGYANFIVMFNKNVSLRFQSCILRVTAYGKL